MDQGTAFVTSLAAGQILAQQLRYGGGGNNPTLGRPKQQTMAPMDAKKNSKEGLPTCPMVYAIITDMNAFGNPKVDNDHYNQYPPTYPADAPPLPALVPLTLGKMDLNVECHISTGFVTLNSVWDVNSVRSRTFCDCILVIPMDNQVCTVMKVFRHLTTCRNRVNQARIDNISPSWTSFRRLPIKLDFIAKQSSLDYI